MKKILFNCTTNIVGGGVKNSAIFIKYAIEDKNNDYFFAISPQVYEILKKWNIEIENLYMFEKSPARNKEARSKLENLANTLDVDLIFTMAGPAYIAFKQTHIMGISNGYITHADFQALSIGKSYKQILKTLALVTYQAYYARKADYWIFQTNEARDGFCKRLFVNKEKTIVISNSIGKEFINVFSKQPIKEIKSPKKITIFCPASAFVHKALITLPNIAYELNKIVDFDFEFILTLDKSSAIYQEIDKGMKKLNVENLTRTIGIFNYADAPSFYAKADIVFVPSILETFSASYLESFAAKKPLIVADKGFARDICGNAAIYTDPFLSKNTATKMKDLIQDKSVQHNLIRNGLDIILQYGDQKDRFEKIRAFLEGVK